jgi:hypothetical protein
MPERSAPMMSSRDAVFDAAKAALERARDAVSRELATIPPPIRACDVDFNRLLEDRAGIVDDLQRLARLRETAAQDDDLLGFARDCAWLDAEIRGRIERTLGASETSRGVPPAGER